MRTGGHSCAPAQLSPCVCLSPRKQSGATIEAGGLIDKHYSDISAASMQTDPKDLKVTDEKKAAFQVAMVTV